MAPVRSFPACLFALLLAAPALAGGPLTSGTPATGSVAGPTYSETWTFNGTTGDRIVVAAVSTSGLLNTVATLRTPTSTVVVSTAADRWDYQLANTGTFTLEITDQGLNDAGSYTLTLINVTAGPLTSGGDADGGAIASGEVRAGTTSGTADLDAFTFTGTNGQRVLFAALESSGAPYNTTITVYPPAGGAAAFSSSGGNRADFQLAATGTYTAIVEDVGNDHAGGYTASLLNVTGGPLTTVADPNGGPVTSATPVTGTINGVVDFDAYTFSGTIGDRIVVAGLTTSGALNTTMSLYPPGGGGVVVNTAADRWDYQLTATGTYTLVVEDQLFGDTGTYTLSFLNVTAGPLTNGSDLDGGAIASGEVRAGATTGAGDLDAFTFTGTNGDRVLFAALESSGAPYNTTVTVYPTAGGPAVFSSSGGNRVDFQLTASGSYAAVIEDIGNDDSGGYTVSFLDVTSGPLTTGADPDGGSIASATPLGGTINGVVDFDAYTFSGTAGDRIAVAGLTTSGALNTTMALYPPGGGGAVVTTAADRWDYQLTATGTYTLVVEDQLFGDTGAYTLSFLNVTAGPLTNGSDLDGGPIASGEVRAGATTGPGDLDAFTFTGATGDRVLFAALESVGAPYNATITIFPPAGGAAAFTSSGGSRADFQLAATGTYTAIIEDIGNDHSGGYTVSFLDLTSGPLTTLADPDGGPLASAAPVAGTMNGVVDFDAYTFAGTAGDRIVVAALATSGTLNTATYLYPPGGGNPVVTTAADRWDYQLTATGAWTVVVEDLSFGETGSYAMSFLNVTAGPLTTVADPDGGPIGSDEWRAGSTAGAADFDAFTFSGTAGDRVLFGGITTGGAGHNTTLTLYPPGGGAAETSTSGGDRIDVRLLATGTYTVVVEDVGDNDAGTWAARFVNATQGPVTGADPDGNWIASGQTRNGTIGPLPDFDVYWFQGQPGDTAKVKCTTTSGALNTMSYLYTPTGSSPVVTTAADNWNYAITVAGRHMLVIQHLDLTAGGTYELQLSGPLTLVDVPGGAAPPARLAFAPSGPNPTRGATSFALALPAAGAVSVEVFDLAGARVRTLARGAYAAGTHTVTWDGADAGGRPVASGVYLVEARTPAGSLTRRVVRIR